MSRSIRGLSELQAFADSFVSSLVGGELVFLIGDLGAGKTAFVQAVAKSLGVTQAVTSPTFTIVAEYEVEGSGAVSMLVHADLYRLDDAVAQSDPVVTSLLSRAKEGALVMIEWADKLGEVSVPHKTLAFSVGEGVDERVIEETGVVD